MAFFDSFTDSIKQKWLQFFQVNRDWIILQMAIESVYTPDGGKRPSSFLILGVVNALEPKLAQLMFPFAKLNPDADTLIEVLGLHFDPDIVLGNRLSPTTEPEIYSRSSQVVTEDSNSSAADFRVVDEEVMVDRDFLEGIDSTENNWDGDDALGNGNGFHDVSLSDNSISEESGDVSSETLDDLGGMPFDPINLTESFDNDALGDVSLSDGNGFDDLNQPDESEFRDVLSDVWGDETSLSEMDDNNDLLGEELPSEVFDESEMARLFPNN